MRSRKAWNELKKELFAEQKAQRDAYKASILAEKIADSRTDTGGGSPGKGTESKAADAVRAGRKTAAAAPSSCDIASF